MVTGLFGLAFTRPVFLFPGAEKSIVASSFQLPAIFPFECVHKLAHVGQDPPDLWHPVIRTIASSIKNICSLIIVCCGSINLTINGKISLHARFIRARYGSHN